MMTNSDVPSAKVLSVKMRTATGIRLCSEVGVVFLVTASPHRHRGRSLISNSLKFGCLRRCAAISRQPSQLECAQPGEPAMSGQTSITGGSLTSGGEQIQVSCRPAPLKIGVSVLTRRKHIDEQQPCRVFCLP